MIKKTILLVLVLSFIGVTASASINDVDAESTKIKEAYKSEMKQYENETNIIQQDSTENFDDNSPTSTFEGNSDKNITISSMNTKIKVEDFYKSKGKVQKSKVIKYKDFCVENKENQSTMISPDRLVYEIQIYYPDGFETRRGIIKNAVVTGLYDAETGIYFGYSVESLG